MGYHKVELREIVGMILCAALSLLAFLSVLVFVTYNYDNQWVALIGLMISLACPVLWLAFLLWKGGGGGGLIQWVKSNVRLPRPAVRRAEQPAGASVEVATGFRLLPLPREKRQRYLQGRRRKRCSPLSANAWSLR